MPNNEEEAVEAHSPIIPSSPPPPFRSRSPSFTSTRQGSYHESHQVDQTLEDTFGNDDDNDGEDDDRERLIRNASTPSARHGVRFQVPISTSDRSGPAAPSNDGVFANLNAKPERGEKLEEHPPVSD